MAGMIAENDLEDIRRWLKMSWREFAAYLGIDAATLWRWRKNGVPAGAPVMLLERLRAEMIEERTRPWVKL